LLVGAGILLLTWAVAGVVNFDSALLNLGANPSAAGVVATLVAVCAWPLAGWLAGSRPGTSFIRFATVFWITIAAGAPLLFWALDSAGASGWVLLLYLPLGLPLYGLSGVLPSWGQPVAQTVVIGVAAFAMTLAAYYARRRIGGRRSDAKRLDTSMEGNGS
jgi:hypothetical protein